MVVTDPSFGTSVLNNLPHASIEGDQVTSSGMTYASTSQRASAMRAIEILTVFLSCRSHQLCTNFSFCKLTASKTATTLLFILYHI